MKELKRFFEEKGKGFKFSFEKQTEGICEFCGNEGFVSRKTVLEKIKGSNHPGTSRGQEGLPFICEDCSFIYSVISSVRPKDLFEGGNMIVIEDGKHYYLENIKEVKQMKKGRYLFIYKLKTSNFLPINFYDLLHTINPQKNLAINYLYGSSFRTLEIETDTLFELLESNDKSSFLINSIRKNLWR